MTAIPVQCQQKADEVTALKRKYNDLADQVNATNGAPVWPLLAQAGEVRRQLVKAKDDLRACIAGDTGTWDATITYGPGVPGQIVTVNATPFGAHRAWGDSASESGN